MAPTLDREDPVTLDGCIARATRWCARHGIDVLRGEELGCWIFNEVMRAYYIGRVVDRVEEEADDQD